MEVKAQKNFLEVLKMKRQKVKCHCGAQAFLRPESAVFGTKSRGGYLYVCSRYPTCDSYVSVHRRNKKPKGTLANAELRQKRIQAHKAFNVIWESGLMEKWQAYRWMQAIFGLNTQQAHIAKFSLYMCDELIRRCEEFRQNNRIAS